MATKIRASNLHTDVKTMVTTMVGENALDSAEANLLIDAKFTANSTDVLSEGSTNLYFTNARADARADTRAQLKIDALVDAAPGSLDTLNELAAALGDDANFSTTITNSVAAKLPLAGGTMTGVIAGFESTGIDDNAANTSVTILSDGHFGIGTTSPDVQFEVQDDSTWDTANFTSANTVGAGLTLAATDTGVRWSVIAQGTTGGGNDNNLGYHLTNAGTSGESAGYKFVMTPSGRFGIGTTSPTHTLHVNNSIRASSSLVSIDPTGSASAPALIFGGDDDSGLWKPASNTLAISTAGSERMRIDSSGRLLLGKTAVDNTTVGFRFDGSSGFSSFVRDGGEPLYLNRKTSDGDMLKFAKDGTIVGSIGTASNFMTIGSGDVGLRFHATNNVIFPHDMNANSTPNGTIDIGSSGSRFKDLYLSGTVTATSFVGSGTISSGAITSTGILTLDTSPAANGTGDLRIIPSLNLPTGVGYAGQVFGVNITNAVHSTHNSPAVLNTWGGVTGATAIALQADDNAYGQFQVWTAPQDSSANDLLVPRFWISGNGTAAFTGNVGIGTTSPVTKLHIQDNFDPNDSYGYALIENNAALSHSGSNAGVNVKSYNGTGQFMQWENYGLRIGSRHITNTGLGDVYITAGEDSTKLVIKANGNVGIGTTSPSQKLDVSGNILASGNVTAYSDISLKDNITPIPNALDKVLQIRGVTYNRNDIEDNPRHTGVIAQEVEKVLPEVISENEDGIKSVAYGNMVGLLVEAIKELKAEIEELKGK